MVPHCESPSVLLHALQGTTFLDAAEVPLACLGTPPTSSSLPARRPKPSALAARRRQCAEVFSHCPIRLTATRIYGHKQAETRQQREHGSRWRDNTIPPEYAGETMAQQPPTESTLQNRAKPHLSRLRRSAFSVPLSTSRSLEADCFGPSSRSFAIHHNRDRLRLFVWAVLAIVCISLNLCGDLFRHILYLIRSLGRSLCIVETCTSSEEL
ncbi:uncharacterized protein EV422DRAFT_92873 [Fimicolochytrium jonesii]|uniref:uncharacterized protein n=1 Tax=Fimicolochytrium jonesii TaxID=1396493 RepID=UPI0022FDD8A4|nr:uncharacterized protein EV422DRAFT_92873 [Fimicolochytrium jonesii]KAI8819950.1 hypothetical protein EV422DRAFT_92873 [Fimicolochytrium jonesii]